MEAGSELKKYITLGQKFGLHTKRTENGAYNWILLSPCF